MIGWRAGLMAAATAVFALAAYRVAVIIVDGQRAIGREDAIEEIRDEVDAVNRARACVRACRDDGGLWDDATGRCRFGDLQAARWRACAGDRRMGPR